MIFQSRISAKRVLTGVLFLFAFCLVAHAATETVSLVAPGAKLETIATGLKFAEGPTCDFEGNLYFSDVADNKIYHFSPDRGLNVFKANSVGANGLCFGVMNYCEYQAKLLFVCQGQAGRIVSFEIPNGCECVVADIFERKPFNRPNDLWVHHFKGIYFTDPLYGKGEMRQKGENVYFIPINCRSTSMGFSPPLCVCSDLKKPNGLIGTKDGFLYIADEGDNKIWRYKINDNKYHFGSQWADSTQTTTDTVLSDKTLFVSYGSDGMTIDDRGNVYLTIEDVRVFNPKGELIETIKVPERTTNVCFGGDDGKTLFITAPSTVYSLKMKVRRAE